MSWFSFLRKNRQEPVPGDGEFYSHSEDTAATARVSSRSKSKEEPLDPALPEKKRARRRLIGAIALTLGLVIGLPMVLDSEPKQSTGDILIQIPSRDKISKLSASRPSASAILATPETISETPEPANAVAAASPSPVIEKSAKADKPAPAKPELVTAKPVPAKSEPTKTDTKESSAKPAVDTAQGKVIIQVAALATQDKVKELQARLTKAGIKSQTQKVATQDGERIRVRIGPFASKAEADKVCPKLDKMSLKCTILPN